MKTTSKILLIAVAAVFALAVNVYADVCYDCEKGELCDKNPVVWDYCGVAQDECMTKQPCDVLFNICDCVDDETPFDANDVIGVRFTILDPAAYWTDGFVSVDFYQSQEDACDETNGYGAYPYTASNYVIEDADDNTCTDAANCAIDPFQSNCSVDEDEDWTIFQAGADDELDMGGAIGQDLIDGQYHWWRINPPQIVIDQAEVAANDLIGETLEYKVELLNMTGGSGSEICVDCSVICSCTLDLVKLCPSAASAAHCMYFPYVTNDIDNWATGIAVTNLAAPEAVSNSASEVSKTDMEITFTLMDSEGDVFTKTYDTNLDYVKTWNLSSIVADLDETPAAGPCSLFVNTNFQADGFAFHMATGATSFGAGTLPRDSGCPAGIKASD